MKIAVVMHNMGGPDCSENVGEFLFNLFNDRAIIDLPGWMRKIIATLIVLKRKNFSRKEYDKIGGRSPILENTQEQAIALEERLKGGLDEFRCFVAMRYSRPFIRDTIEEIKKYDPDRVVQLPLYPQFSFTTTGSSFKEFDRQFNYGVLVGNIKSYPEMEGFISSIIGNVLLKYWEIKKFGNPRILFSAHGLPQRKIMAGDPYKQECEKTVAALVRKLSLPKLDYVLCFQSNVGPLKWIGPETKAEIERAGRDRVPVIVVPISFVSENLETLVELKINGREVARKSGVPFYDVVETVGKSQSFIGGLARMVREAIL